MMRKKLFVLPIFGFIFLSSQFALADFMPAPPLPPQLPYPDYDYSPYIPEILPAPEDEYPEDYELDMCEEVRAEIEGCAMVNDITGEDCSECARICQTAVDIDGCFLGNDIQECFDHVYEQCFGIYDV